MPKRVLGDRYELDRRLGRGGMAEVWRGIDRVLARRVAVKTFSLADAADPALSDMVNREAIATAALEHPDIVTVHDAGVDGDTAYIVMERLRGRDLAAVLSDGPLPLAEALRIAGRVAGALAAAHAVGIVHRDVKPANILIDDSRVMVVDFGIAAFEYQPVTSLAEEGTTHGTAEYMAPEQARAESATRSTDMYSFGCLLTALIAGRPPFTGARPEAILHQHVFIDPPRLAQLSPGVPEALDVLVSMLLAKDPDGRPSAETVVEVLTEVAARLTGEAAGMAPGSGWPGSLGGTFDAPTAAPEVITASAEALTAAADVITAAADAITAATETHRTP
ncbi:serine/threonine protein kinase [Georgenia yuyongxinii]|uniref:non-specific serine/threonine protein kinase n=1 Tax=Georgenia yuyongxinii TaxID=2589797 RepID=A0A5B8BZW5_9MICO|nr:serine/threonine protein kinase [Georgenia yuyongxinii]